MKPAVEQQWQALPATEKGGKKGPPLSFKNVVRDGIYNALPTSEKEALKVRAQAAKQVKVVAYEAALNALPSKDPEVMLRYVLLFQLALQLIRMAKVSTESSAHRRRDTPTIRCLVRDEVCVLFRWTESCEERRD